MKRDLYALHRDRDGHIVGANAFKKRDEYGLGTWVRELDIHDGDTITFGEVQERPEFAEVEPERKPALLEEPEVKTRHAPGKPPVLADAEDDKPF